MAYDEDNAIVLWPEYFDKSRSRSEGRRLPKSLCVDSPSLDIIAKGAILLDLDYRIIEKKAYPGNWINRGGCVRVERRKMKKTAIISAIGKILVSNS
ncbi:MAG: signal recognition particle subunit SRP19/SEC65 family protein [archaeon]|nr:signal recognition particle subunit SRP19/SEC65 family protein [archaeon]